MITCFECGKDKPYKDFSKSQLRIAYRLPSCKDCVYIRSAYSRYGITEEEYDLLFFEQRGCCAICGIHSSELKRRLHVDHCHETQKIRGLLCSNCNSAMGLLKEDKEILTGMISYLMENSTK